MFNYIKKSVEEPNPQLKPEPQVKPIKAPAVVDPKPKKEKQREAGLSEIENKVLNFIRNFPSPFPRTPWTISNYCEISENQAIKICKKLVADPKFRIQEVEHCQAEFAYEEVCSRG